MDERDGENALWWAVAAGAFLLWRAGAWLAARGRWQRARERGVVLPPPRFMEDVTDGVASFLVDLLPVLAGVAQIAAAFGGTLFVVFGIAAPLWVHYGPVAGIAGGALVWGIGASVSLAVVVRIVERRREAVNRERARLVSTFKASSGNAS